MDCTLPGWPAASPGQPRARPSFIIGRVTSPLSDIEIEKRRQVAATLGLFATLCIAIGAVAATGATTALIKGFVVVALLIADPPLPYADISARLGIPVGSIGPNRSRYLDKMRRHPAVAALINA